MKEIEELLKITQQLKNRYQREFTLDGKLVGDIGEVLATEKYCIELLPVNTTEHDAIEENSGRLVQIKSTMINKPTFPCNHVPQYLLALQIESSGEIIELYNGPGQKIVDEYIIPRGLRANNGRYLYTLSANILKELNSQIPEEDKITLRNQK